MCVSVYKAATKDLLATYALLTMAYGFGRKMPILYDATTETYNQDGKRVRVPMLLTTKVLVTGASTLASIYIWPFYLHNDLSRIEMYTKGYNPEDYNYRQPRYCVDYIFL
jgi:hypothetical protein